MAGECITNVSTVAFVGHPEGVGRPTGFLGIRTACGVCGPLEPGNPGVRDGRRGDWRMDHERWRTFIISMLNL